MTDLRGQLQSTLGTAYTIERELGGGGMSRVFVAEENAFGRKVVVKVVPPDVSAGVNIDRFKREIQVSARLQHPHIVPLLTAGEMQGIPYYTMPFVDGESLRSRLRSGPLSITESISVLADTAKALAYAHAHGVVHRDIKPDNILISSGAASVADFGIAKAISAARDETHATITQIGVSIGTPAYMAPEQAAADPATNHRADIYAFGCVAYEVLTGRPPFTAKNPQRLLAAHMGDAPEPVTQHRPDTPAELANLVMQCLAKDADERPQNAQDLVRVLETVTSGGGHAALPPILVGGPGAFRKALMYYAAAFVVVLIVSQAAVISIGLPDWVVPGATVIMLMGLPVILFTGYVQRVTRHAITMTPTYTPGGTQRSSHGTMATLAMKASPHVSWHRTYRGGMVALGAFVLLIAAFMTLRALGIGPAGSLFASGKLAANDKLLVADFKVTGADSSLGPVIAEAIRTDLGQSRSITLMSSSAVRAALGRMKQRPDARLTSALAKEMAQREGAKAIVDGEITPLGTGFIVSARLVTAGTGDELASFHETANGAVDLIPTVQKLSRALRAKIGESLRAVHASPELDKVTTPSLEALQKFTEGSTIGDIDVPKAIGLLKEAVAIDSGFAMAWRKLAVMYSNSGYPRALIDTAATRAFRFRERLTDTERDNVEGYYYGTVVRDRAKEIAAYERAVARGDFGPATHNLALRLSGKHEFARAESLMTAFVRTGNAPLVTYQNLALNLTRTRHNADSAKALIKAMDARFGKTAIGDRVRVIVNYQIGQLDSSRAGAEVLSRSKDLFGQSEGARLLAIMDEVQGRLASSARNIARFEVADSARGAFNSSIEDAAWEANWDAWYRGKPEATVRKLDALMPKFDKMDRLDRPWLTVSAVYARAGRPDKARAVLARWEAELDTATKRQRRQGRDRMLAEIVVAEKHYLDAIPLYRRSDSLPDGLANGCDCSAAWIGRAFDLAGQSDSAIVYLEHYLKDAGPAHLLEGEDAPFRAPTTKRLGELYEAKGERQKAISYYQQFVDLWKDADPDLQPRVAEVRKRIARLSAVEKP